jgi:hypothetical protein
MRAEMKICSADGCNKQISKNAKKCGSCSKKGSIPWNKGIVWEEGSARQVGEKNTQWKGDDAGYKAIHVWLNRRFGKPDHCEMCGTREKKQPKFFHWAKLKGKQYTHDRENFWMLCVNCHNEYDSGEYQQRKKDRSKAIAEQVSSGKTRKDIAQHFGVTESHVGWAVRKYSQLRIEG